MELMEFVVRLLVAFALGAAIGAERQWMQKSAGLRTNTLVSMGSSAFILLSIHLGNDATGRIAAYIVSGIGFLGAGVIMKDGQNVQGLNTAATIWCSAAVGAMSGVGMIPEAVIVAVVIMLTHIVLRPLGVRLSRLTFIKSTNTETDYLFTIRCRTEVENHIRVLLLQMLEGNDKLLLKSLASDDTNDSYGVVITAEIKAVTPHDSLMERVASRLTIEDRVSKVSWEIIGTQSEV